MLHNDQIDPVLNTLYEEQKMINTFIQKLKSDSQ